MIREPRNTSPLLIICPSCGRACGVAAYTKRLQHGLAAAAVESDVATSRDTAAHALARRAYAGILVQFEYALYRRDLDRLLRLLAAVRLPVALTMHGVNHQSRGKREVNRRLFALPSVAFVVHSEVQRESLRLSGLFPGTPVHVIPIGCPDYSSTFGPAATVRREMGLEPDGFLAGFFGFASTHKGLPNLIQALALLPEVRGYLAATLHPANPGALSRVYEACGLPHASCGSRAVGNVTLVHDFIPDAVFGRHQNAVDVIVLPYAALRGSVSASMMVCDALASRRPVVVTDMVYFAGHGGEVFRIPDNRPETIATAIRTLRDDQGLRSALTARAADYAQRHSWALTVRRYLDVLSERRGQETGKPRLAASRSSSSRPPSTDPRPDYGLVDPSTRSRFSSPAGARKSASTICPWIWPLLCSLTLRRSLTFFSMQGG